MKDETSKDFFEQYEQAENKIKWADVIVDDKNLAQYSWGAAILPLFYSVSMKFSTLNKILAAFLQLVILVLFAMNAFMLLNGVVFFVLLAIVGFFFAKTSRKKSYKTREWKNDLEFLEVQDSWSKSGLWIAAFGGIILRIGISILI